MYISYWYYSFKTLTGFSQVGMFLNNSNSNGLCVVEMLSLLEINVTLNLTQR